MAKIPDKRLRAYTEAALWYKALRETNNESFLPLFFDEHRYLVLKGGGGSGKSIFAGRKVLERVTTEPGHRWLVARKVARTLRQSCFAQLVSQGNRYYSGTGMKVNKTDMQLSFANGSQILFAGLDDVEKLKSIFDITGIWIEEASELEEGDFNQLDIRLRTDFPYYLQMVLSFNPISITHWLKGRFFDRQDPRARVHESTYKDNRFLTEEAIRTLEAFKETDLYYYQVYALNQWGVTGKTVFDAMAISRRLEELRGPVAEGEFVFDYDGLRISNVRWAEGPGGPVKIYRWPEKGRPYVVGGDTAGGADSVSDNKDWFVGQCIDNITGRQVAVYRASEVDEDLFARQMYCLGTFYNTALLAVEANFSTYPIKELQRLGYPRQFVREREDTFDGGVRHAFGFRTDPITRPVILSGLIAALRGHYDLLEDQDTLHELLTFVREPKKLRMEAEPGAHDDCVMALAIAFYARGQQAMEAEKPAAERKRWTDDMWEDYLSSDEGGRQYLIAKWGQPAP